MKVPNRKRIGCLLYCAARWGPAAVGDGVPPFINSMCSCESQASWSLLEPVDGPSRSCGERFEDAQRDVDGDGHHLIVSGLTRHEKRGQS
jgi:hypothetical protein